MGQVDQTAAGLASIASYIFRRKPVHFQPVKLDPATYGQEQFLRQSENVPQVGNMLGKIEDAQNTYLQKSIGKIDPAYLSSIGLMGAQSQALQDGNVPLTIGGKQYSARDLGLTTDMLQREGAQAFGQTVKENQAFNPFHFSTQSQLFSPQDLLARQDAVNYHNNDLLNQGNLIRSQKMNPFLAGNIGFTRGFLGSIGGGGGMGGGGGGGMGGGFGGGEGGGEAAAGAAAAAG